MTYSEVEKSLQQDIREQKRTARGIHSKKGSRGYVGRMLFPSDFMSKEEKRAYKKAGKVKVYSMFDTIISYDEFKKLPEEEKVRYLAEYRKRFKGQEIADGLGITVGSYYSLASSLGVSKKYTHSKSKAKVKSKDIPKNEEIAKNEVVLKNEDIPAVELVQPKDVIYKPNGIVFGYGGNKSAEDIIKVLSKLELLLDGEDSTFEVEIKIKEITVQD